MLLYQEGPITFDYDSKFDTLYASINGKDKSHSYGDDRVPELIVARDMETDEIVGFTIFRYIRSNMERTRAMLERYFSSTRNLMFNQNPILIWFMKNFSICLRGYPYRYQKIRMSFFYAMVR